MSGKDIREIPTGWNYEQGEQPLYIFQLTRVMPSSARNDILRQLRESIPKSSKLILLDEYIDYIPPYNEALMKRIDVIEDKIDKAMSLIESILAERFKP